MYTHTHIHIYIYIYIYISMYLPTHLARAECNTRSIFNKFEFSFPSRQVAIPWSKNQSALLFSIAGGRIFGFVPFIRGLASRSMQTASSMIEFASACAFPVTITITLRAPLQYIYIYIYIYIYSRGLWFLQACLVS